MRHLSILVLILLTTSMHSNACTTFCINNERHLVLGKNLDFYTGIGHLVVNKRNIAKSSFVLPGERSLQWTSRYGSLTFNQAGREFPYGGINEKGLVIEQMWLADTKYPSLDERVGLVELQWIQYQLDNSASVEEVIASDKSIRISSASAPIHFMVCDASGNISTIEYIDGKMNVHTGSTLPICALSNDTYDLSHNNMKGLTTSDKENLSTSSYDRFAKAAMMVQDFKGDDAISYAFKVLYDVKQGEFTRWSIVYDIKSMKVHFKTLRNNSVRTLDIRTIDFSCKSTVVVADIDSSTENNTPDFKPYTYENNATLIEAMFAELVGKPEFINLIPPKEERDLLARYPETMYCKE